MVVPRRLMCAIMFKLRLPLDHLKELRDLLPERVGDGSGFLVESLCLSHHSSSVIDPRKTVSDYPMSAISARSLGALYLVSSGVDTG